MRKAKIESVASVNLASQVITNVLFKSIDSGKVYIGREEDFSKFNQALMERYDCFPNIIAISGLNGIGRRTFVGDIFDKRYNLNYHAEFRLKDFEGLNELYGKLLDENIEHFSKEDIEELIKEFSKLNIEEKCSEIARLLACFTEKRAYPVLVDEGAMLDNSGYYLLDFLNLLKLFAERYSDHYLVIIHRRIPQLKPCDKDLIYIRKLNELSEPACFSALDSLLKKNNIQNANKEQITELAKYIDGYPPAIYYAVNECILYGVDVVCNDKTKLVDFKSGVFSGYLDSLILDELDNKIIKLLYSLGTLSTDIISLLLEETPEDIAKSLTKCINYCIVSVNVNGDYYIASPINVAISRKYSAYDKDDMKRFSYKLIYEFNKNSTDKSIEFINVVITTLLHAEKDEELQQFKAFLLPSKLISIAQNFNINREWRMAEKYVRKALELDPTMLDAKILLFKLLVRQEPRVNIGKIEEEENAILSYLEEKYDRRKYYLCGFRFWKRRHFYNAIEQFELGKKAGDDSIPLHRDLAECYFQINDIAKAREEIALVMKPGRKIINPFILDLAAKIAIYSYDFPEARELISRLECIDNPANVLHRKATLAIKEKQYDYALNLANDACASENVLPQMIMLRMNIAIHSDRFDIVENDYKTLSRKNDIIEILYASMLLKRDGWRAAEASLCKIFNKNSAIAQNLYYKILLKKSMDETVSFLIRKKAKSELEKINISKMQDVLDVAQFYERRNDNMDDWSFAL